MQQAAEIHHISPPDSEVAPPSPKAMETRNFRNFACNFAAESPPLALAALARYRAS